MSLEEKSSKNSWCYSKQNFNSWNLCCACGRPPVSTRGPIARASGRPRSRVGLTGFVQYHHRMLPFFHCEVNFIPFLRLDELCSYTDRSFFARHIKCGIGWFRHVTLHRNCRLVQGIRRTPPAYLQSMLPFQFIQQHPRLGNRLLKLFELYCVHELVVFVLSISPKVVLVCVFV